VNLASAAVIAPIGAFCIGGGLARRDHRLIGVGLIVFAVLSVLVLAALGMRRPLVGLVAVTGIFMGLEVDLPGNARRRALGLLGVAVGFFALIVAAFYT
jgi:hypothetical protein